MPRFAWVFLLPAFCATLPAEADVEGRVVSSEGRPIEGARVSGVGDGPRAVTDARGRFRLRGVDPPLTLRVDDPRFEPLVADVAEAGTLLTLVPKHTAYEQVVVTANAAADVVAPASSPAAKVEPDDLPAPGGTVVDLAVTTPGVAESGQGGRFQAYSVRGVAGQRVFTTVAGVRIVTERRAGATSSFVDPLLLDRVEVVRGPASTLYGSGALGGVVQVLPRTLEAAEVGLGYASQGNERSLFAGWGGGGWTAALAGRDSDDGEDGDGRELFNHSTQWSGLLRKRWERESGTTLELLALPAAARDVAKPNTRYPERITQYPEESHLLLRFAARLAAGWRLAAFAHPNDLETENLRATSRSLVTNEAFDWGLDAQRDFALGGAWTMVAGLDWFGRSDVTADEDVEDFDTGDREQVRTLDGSEGQAALFATVHRPLGRATFELGARFTRIDQENLGASSDDSAPAGFVGATLPLGSAFELAANVGNGLRFPSLSERFFSGSTGRGQVVANDDLDPERSLSADLGLRYFGKRLYVQLFAFRNEIDDYIEQVELSPGVETFVNLTAGTIDGVDLDGWVAAGERLRITWSGSTVSGESEAGEALADIPADRVALGARYERGRWRAAGRVEHRFDKTDPGPGEVDTSAVDLLSASLACDVSRRFELRLAGGNLLDRTYRPSADELAVAAPGRDVALSVTWRDR